MPPVSQRGVVFFRAQDNLTDELQKTLVQKLGVLAGKPSSSTLHVHPVLNSTSEFGVGDNEISHISSKYREFLEGLTATSSGDGFLRAAAADPEHVKIYTEPRGSPHNVGAGLTAVNPVVRTNAVTGWESIFALGPFPKRINELTEEESDEILRKFERVLVENHDLQVRFKWRNPNDIVI